MPRRILEGEVVSDKMDKTVTVLVARRYIHPMYKKYVKRTDRYAAHDENNSFSVGDRVQIQECRPISKRKSWTVITDPSQGTPRPEKVKAVEESKPVKKAAAKKADDKEEKKTKAKSTAKKVVKKDEKAEKPKAKETAKKASDTKKKTTKKATTSKKKDEEK